MNLDSLLYWMREREDIRIRKQLGGHPPWTTDPILQQYRFTCVRREDDKVTRWIAHNIREPYANSSLLWYMLCIARQLNWPPTLQELIEARAWPHMAGFEPEHMTPVLEARKARGEKVFTGVYMIRGESNPTVHWRHWSKSRYVAEIVLGYLWDARDGFPAGTLEKSVGWLTGFRGWGPFLSYQAVVDMRFTGVLGNAPDRDSWAAAGPGTIRGLNRVAGRPVKQALSQVQALEEIREIYPRLLREMPIDLSDVPSILCETDKYLRVQNGEGFPRNLYHVGVTR